MRRDSQVGTVDSSRHFPTDLPPGHERAAPEAEHHPLANLQRRHGNRTVQRLLDHGIQPKLRVGSSNDRYEREAERMARAVTRLPASWTAGDGGGDPKTPTEPTTPEPTERAAPRVQRLCTRCRDRFRAGKPLDCPDCERTLQRSEGSTGGDAPAVTDAVEGDIARASGAGRPLPAATRSFFESRFGHEFGDVRVHSDGRAARLNRALDARAFTYGRDVFFGTNEYRPESAAGKWLLAHELTHVVHQRGRENEIQRQSRSALDPTNPMAWSFLDKLGPRGDFSQNYMATLGAATVVDLRIGEELQREGTETVDEAARERIRERIRTLVRMRALGLMASHRASIVRRMGQVTADDVSRAADPHALPPLTASAARDAAKDITELRNKIEAIEDSLSELRVYGMSIDRDDLRDRMQEFDEATRVGRTPGGRLARLIEEGRQAVASRPADGNLLMYQIRLARQLRELRREQVAGLQVLLQGYYQQFPFYASEVDAEDVAETSFWDLFGEDLNDDDEVLMERVREGYDDLLESVDDVIVQIGSEDIHPLDLPVAVESVRSELPVPLQSELASMIRSREQTRFWTSLGLTAAEIALIFVPVVGPALAAGLGATMLAVDVEDLLDRQAMAAASTSVDESLLGVQGPGAFDYVMLGVQAALTAVDLGGIVRSLRIAGPMVHSVEEAGGAARAVDELDPDPSPPSRPASAADEPPQGTTATEVGPERIESGGERPPGFESELAEPGDAPPARPPSGGGSSGGSFDPPSLLQRQRAAALRREADELEAQAIARERDAVRIEETRPEGAANARRIARERREEAARLRREADEYASGRRSATEDLPGPEDVDELFEEALSDTPVIEVPLHPIERLPSRLPRMVRGLMRSRSGNRVVFRVEGGGSRELVRIDDDGGVSIAQTGSSIHLNFGSADRALEFLAKRGPGSRIVAFEVDEGWIQSLRSAAIPEHGTGALSGRQPRLVDVTYADDQLEIPSSLIGELQDFIVPNTGRVVILK